MRTNTTDALRTCVTLGGILLLGYVASAGLSYLMPRAAAKGLGFFAVSIAAYLVMWKRRRVEVFVAVILSIFVGLLFFLGELLWPRT